MYLEILQKLLMKVSEDEWSGIDWVESMNESINEMSENDAKMLRIIVKAMASNMRW